MNINLTEWGWDPYWEHELEVASPSLFQPARIVAAHRDLSLLQTPRGLRNGVVSGKFRSHIERKADYPVVGDWVLTEIVDAELAIIHQILPRKTVLSRKSAGHAGNLMVVTPSRDVVFGGSEWWRHATPDWLAMIFHEWCRASRVGHDWK